MADQGGAEKKHAPTSDRLRKARREGNIPQSQEVSSVLMLATLLGLLAASTGSLLRCFSQLINSGVTFSYRVGQSEEELARYVYGNAMSAGEASLPFLLGTLVVSVAGSVLVSGWTFSPKQARFDFTRLSPMKGIMQLFNSRSLVTLLVASIKLGVVTAVVWEYLGDQMDTLLSLVNCTLQETLDKTGELVMNVSLRIVLAMAAIAAADLVWQKWKYKHDLRMTDQEVKEERRQHEGNPQIKSKIRAVQFEMARKRMLQEVPKADVVLVNPTHVAVALRYDMTQMQAPVVLAKGGDLMCEKIKEIARAHGVPIVHRPELARALFAQVEINDPIPEALFVAVAEVLATVYRLNKGRKKV